MARKFVFETDWCEDCDDCVALRFLLRNLDEEHILLGVNVNATSELSYASLRAFIENEGKNIPVAVDEPKYPGIVGQYHKNMAQGSPYTNADAEKTLDFYKRVLEENDDVEILSVGFLSSLESVFKTYPKLLKKVKKLWIMGGKWSVQGGNEYNFNHYPAAVQATRFVVNELNIPKIYLGFEVGMDVLTGSKLSEKDMLGRTLADWGCPHGCEKEYTQGRPSWDPMLVLAALEDKFENAFDKKFGRCYVDEGAKSYYEEDENSKDAYLVKIHDNSYYAQIIDEIIKE